MKKILYIICAIFALTACNKEELITPDGQNPDGSYTFNIGIEEPHYVVGSAPKTRAEVKMTRYLLEMYEGSLSATPVKMENTDGVFTVDLKKGVDYVCLFWADGGAADYDATSLKAVKQTDETKTGTAAYCAGVTVNSKTFNGTVTLKRAVAELSFIDKNGLTDASNTLKITYPYASATLNVGDGTVTYAAGTAVRTITGITPPAQATDAFTTDFILAPKEAGKLAELKFQLNTEEEKTVAETAVQANFRTKITGEYQPKPIPPLAVGDFYMKDGTWLPGTTTLTTQQQTDCIGIVYWVGDPTANDAALKAAHPACTHGLVVALKDETSAWQSTYATYGKTVNEWTIANTTYAPIFSGSALTDPINKIMGYNNTKAIQAFNAANSANKVEAIEKIVAYQTAVPTPASNSGWFLPSTKELTLLCGLANQDVNVYDDRYGTGNRDAINAQLAKIDGATQITKTYYWSSTEFNGDGAWNVYFDDGLTPSNLKSSLDKVRAVLAF